MSVKQPGSGHGPNLFAPLTDDPRYKWKVLACVIFGLFMVILDSTVVNVALKALQTKFTVSTNEAQWVISLYTLALGIATPLSAFLGEKYGIKKIYVGALAAFVIGSALCGIAIGASDNLTFLIAARALQGVGGGLGLPLGTAMLFGAFPPRERGIALGIFGIALVFAPASGPLLGGWLVDHDQLPWIFLVNIPIGLLGITLASRWLRDRKSERVLKADLPGILFSTIGFGALLYGASIAGEPGGGWSAPETLAVFAVGIAALAVFSFVELRTAEPLLDLRLFAVRTFTIANIVGWVGIIGLFGAEFLLPLYLQILRGKSAFDTGLFLLPLALVSGFVTPIAGRLADKFGPRLPLTVGFALIAFNTWQFRDIRIDTDLGWISFLLIVRGIGFGLVIQNTLVAALADVPGRLTARATSLTNATRQTVQSIGVALLATILTSAVTVVPSAAQPMTPAAIAQFQAQYISGLDHAYTATFVVALLAALLALLLPGWPGRVREPAPAPQHGEVGAGAPLPSH